MSTWQSLGLQNLVPDPILSVDHFILVWQLFRAVLCAWELQPAQGSGDVPGCCQQLSGLGSSKHTLGLVDKCLSDQLIQLCICRFSISPSLILYLKRQKQSCSRNKSFGGAQDAMFLTSICCAIKIVWLKGTVFSET